MYSTFTYISNSHSLVYFTELTVKLLNNQPIVLTMSFQWYPWVCRHLLPKVAIYLFKSLSVSMSQPYSKARGARDLKIQIFVLYRYQQQNIFMLDESMTICQVNPPKRLFERTFIVLRDPILFCITLLRYVKFSKITISFLYTSKLYNFIKWASKHLCLHLASQENWELHVLVKSLESNHQSHQQLYKDYCIIGKNKNSDPYCQPTGTLQWICSIPLSIVHTSVEKWWGKGMALPYWCILGKKLRYAFLILCSTQCQNTGQSIDQWSLQESHSHTKS